MCLRVGFNVPAATLNYNTVCIISVCVWIKFAMPNNPLNLVGMLCAYVTHCIQYRNKRKINAKICDFISGVILVFVFFFSLLWYVAFAVNII